MFLILCCRPADYTCNSSNNTHQILVFSVCLYQIHLIYVIHNDNKHHNVDFAGPFLGNMWMLVMDAYSKWISVVRMSNYPTTETELSM